MQNSEKVDDNSSNIETIHANRQNTQWLGANFKLVDKSIQCVNANIAKVDA